MRRVIVTINYCKVIESKKGLDYLRVFTNYINYLFIILDIIRSENFRKGNTINPNAFINCKKYVNIASKFLLAELTNNNNIKENKENKKKTRVS